MGLFGAHPRELYASLISSTPDITLLSLDSSGRLPYLRCSPKAYRQPYITSEHSSKWLLYFWLTTSMTCVKHVSGISISRKSENSIWMM